MRVKKPAVFLRLLPLLAAGLLFCAAEASAGVRIVPGLIDSRMADTDDGNAAESEDSPDTWIYPAADPETGEPLPEDKPVSSEDLRPVPVIRSIQPKALTAALITWSRVPEAKAYLVYSRAGTGPYELLKRTVNCLALHMNMERGKVYHYRVQAVYASPFGEDTGLFSEAAKYVTLSAVQPKVSSESSVESIRITWNDVRGAAGYKVFRNTSKGYKLVKTTAENEAVLSNLEDGTVYGIRVLPFQQAEGNTFYGAEAVISAKTKKRPKKWLFVGDSYCTVGGSPFLPDLIVKELGIQSHLAHCKGGYGVARTGKTFLSLVKDIPPDETVTHVLLVGGISNDRKHSKREIQDAIRLLAETIRSRFPKAVLFYTIGNWHGNAFGTELRKNAVTYQNRVWKRLPWYREACAQQDILFLNGPEYALRGSGNDAYFRMDMHHPNEKGRRKLARAIAAAVRRRISDYA
jgi:lysophospholipase L1-like esterase